MHVHSYWSDGELSPMELVIAAKAKGIKGIALTDHDTFSGVREWKQIGSKMDFCVYSGVEISCMDFRRKRPIHILGYGIEENGMEQMEKLLCPLRDSMVKAVEKSVLALQGQGYPVSLEDVYQKAGPGRMIYKQMVMELLMEAGLCGELYGPLYWELFKTGKHGQKPVAKLEVEYANPKEAVKAIHEAGGFAVLAHPGQYDSYEAISELVEAGLVGIEVYHPLHTGEHVERSLKLAQKYGLKVTGGSDFHGKYGEGEVLGQCGIEQMPF